MPVSMPWVCALNALQNSMMFKPRCPKAGPIGGDGLALPAGTCSLMKPTTFFAMIWSLNLLDLRVFELDRGRPAEDRHRHLEPRLFLVDFLDEAVERGERPVRHAHLLADLESDRRLRPLDAFLDLAHDARRLGLRDRHRPALAAQESGDLRRVLDEMPSLVGQIHLHQDVAGKELALRADLGAALDLDNFLGRHQHFLEFLGHALLLGLFADRLRDFLLEAGIDVDDIPASGHDSAPRPEPEHEAHEMAQAEIDQEEEDRRRDDHGKDHGRGDSRLPAGGPSDAAHLLADLPQKFYRSGSCHDVPLETALYSARRREIPEFL